MAFLANPDHPERIRRGALLAAGVGGHQILLHQGLDATCLDAFQQGGDGLRAVEGRGLHLG